MKAKKLFVLASALVCSTGLVAGCAGGKEKPKEPEEPGQKEEATLVSISATMSKVTYVEGDALQLNGLVVTAHYSDNTEKAITGYTLNHEEGYELQLGDKLIVTLGQKSCEIALTITEKNVVLESISATISKSNYFVGDAIGAVTVTGHYSNGTEGVIEGGYALVLNGATIGASHEMALGENSLVVTFEGLSAKAIELSVVEDSVVSIAVSNKFRQFAPGDEFVQETVTATYASGKTGTVQAKFAGYDMLVSGKQTVSVTYEGLAPISYEIEVDEKYSTKVSVVLSVAAEVTELHRHDVVSTSVKLRNAEMTDVTYSIEGAATISLDGVITVSDEATVGSDIKITAHAKDVDSNTITLKVGHTLPTEIVLSADKGVVREDQTVTLTPSFTPAYTTKTDVIYSVNEEAKDVVQIVNGVVSLKNGVSQFEHNEEKVTITATSADVGEVSANVQVVIGYVDMSLSLSAGSVDVERDSDKLDKLSLVVKAYDEDDEEIEVPMNSYTFSSSNPDVVVVGEHTGKITVVGHGKAEITAKLGKTTTTSSFTVIVPPEEISYEFANSQVILGKGLKTGVGEANKIKSPFASVRSDSYVFSEKLDYTFSLEGSDKKSEEIATVGADGYITFKEMGNVTVTAKSNSTIGDVTSSREKTYTAKFVVNDLTNIYKQENLHFALNNPDVKGVNIMNDIMFQKMLNVEVEGEETTYSSYWEYNGNEEFLGFTSRGDKTIQGNGFKLSLEELELANITNVEAIDAGEDLLEFAAKEYDNSIEPTEDVIGTPYHVEIHDFSIIGQSDYQGDYLGKIEDYQGVDVAKGSFTQSFRRGLRVGFMNAKAGFSTFDGKTGQPRRDIQKCANAYVDKPILENVTIQGFETGLRSEHVVDGFYTGLNISDCYNNASEVNQCIVEYNNTTIKQVGGFAIEVVPDGMDMTNIFQGGQLNIDFMEAGKDYDKLPEVKMTGKIDAINMNDGTSTERMQGLKLGNFTIKDIVLVAVQDMIKKVGMELIAKDPTTYGFLASKLNDVVSYVTGALLGVMYNAQQEIDFFGLMFLYEYNNFLKAMSTVIMGSDICNFHCDKDASGQEADSITLHDLIENILITYVATSGAAKYEGYKAYKYIIFDLNGETIESQAANLGTVVLVNLGYDASYIPE